MTYGDIRDIQDLYCDDITFCQEQCDWLSCPRNQKNIRDKTIPHSFFVEIPEDCPKKGKTMKRMPDLKKVVKGLEIHTGLISSCEDGCPYFIGDGRKCKDLLKDALSVLKEQEPVEPKVIIDTWVCGNCGTRLERQSMVGDNILFTERFDYCPRCGRKVLWGG